MISLLSFDPSSSACGVAYWPSIDGRDPDPSFLHVILPLPGESIADFRVDDIVDAVLTLARRFLPSHVVLEYSGGHQAGRKRGRMRGLATLGQSQGRVYQALIDMARNRTSHFDPVAIIAVGEDWTGRTPKDERALVVAAACPIYAAFLKDGHDGTWRGIGEWNRKGLDAADAVGLGWHWIARHKIDVLAGATR